MNGVQQGDGADAGLHPRQGCKTFRDIIADRRNDPGSGDKNTFGHAFAEPAKVMEKFMSRRT